MSTCEKKTYGDTVCFVCQAKLLEAEFQLTGSNAYAARFGETIADLGDLDDDGYPGNDHTCTDLPISLYSSRHGTTNTSAANTTENTITIATVNRSAVQPLPCLILLIITASTSSTTSRYHYYYSSSF